MKYFDLGITELHKALVNKEVSVEELVKEAIKRAKEDTNNAFEMIINEDAISKAKELDKSSIPESNLFYGIPFVAKNNFSTKGYETNASSNILNGYVPVFDATVITLLENAGAILIGKTTLDELAMGGTGTTGHLGVTYNPYDLSKTHLCGGSSVGSAAAVASGIVPFALGSDTGDSVRKPASYTGLVGFKPTWGLISRFGLFPFAPSLDHVAYFTRSVEDSALALDILSKHDENDSTSSFKKRDVYGDVKANLKGKKIAVINQIINSITDKTLKDKFNKSIEYFNKNGAKVLYIDFDLDLLKAIYPTYFIISCAEATSNNANLDGIKFGPNYGGKTYEEVMFNARTRGFSPLIKRRFVIGSYALMRENQKELFLRAQKVRHVIVDKVNEIFKDFDAIYLPAAPSVAPKIDNSSENVNENYVIADNWLAIGNFGGFPSITLPIGIEDDLPLGVNLTAKPFDEKNLLSIALGLEEHTGLKGMNIFNYKDLNKEGK